MSSFIFILYCFVGCDAPQPHHRGLDTRALSGVIHSAYETLERCDEAKRYVESICHSVYSCETINTRLPVDRFNKGSQGIHIYLAR
jgi:hypothetical protein